MYLPHPNWPKVLTHAKTTPSPKSTQYHIIRYRCTHVEGNPFSGCEPAKPGLLHVSKDRDRAGKGQTYSLQKRELKGRGKWSFALEQKPRLWDPLSGRVGYPFCLGQHPPLKTASVCLRFVYFSVHMVCVFFKLEGSIGPSSSSDLGSMCW